MRSKLIGFTFMLVWATAVLGAYYVFHKPFDVLNLEAILTSTGSLLAVLAVSTACAGIGRAVVRWTLITNNEGFPRLALEFGIGFGLLGLLWLGLAAAGLLGVWVAWLVLIATIALSFREWQPWWTSLLSVVRSWAPINNVQRVIAIIVVALGAMSLVDALSPPHEWDALMYHLTSPLHHIQAGQLIVEPSLPESGYPQLVEMHYTWLLLLGVPRAAAVLHWFLGIMTSLFVISLTRRWINDQAAWLALAMLYSAGTWTTLMGAAYIDLALVFFATLAFAKFVEWVGQPSFRQAVLLGSIAAFAFGVKYTGAWVGLSLAIIMVWRWPRQALKTLIYFGVAALILALPWLLKNLPTGNPMYPFIWQGEGWDSIRQAWFSRVGSGLLETAPSQLLTAPILLTILGADGAQTWDASFGPLLLMFTPVLLLGWRAYRDQPWYRYGLAWIGLLYAAWLLGAATSSLLIIPRLLFPLVPVLVILLAGSALRLFEVELKGLSLGRITLALMIVVLTLTTFGRVGEMLGSQSLQVALGWTSSEDFLYQELGWYHGAVRSIDALGDTSRVLFLFEPRAYHCPADRCIPDGILDRWYWSRQRDLTNPEILSEWRDQGATHVLVYQLGVELLQAGEDLLTNADWNALDQFVLDYLVEIENFGDAYILYEIQADSAGEP
jgi:hypothetical protein